MISAGLQTVPGPVSTDHTNDNLWHIAADRHNDHRADHGLTWHTRCGQHRPPVRAVKPAVDATPDDCLVCTSLFIANSP